MESFLFLARKKWKIPFENEKWTAQQDCHSATEQEEHRTGGGHTYDSFYKSTKMATVHARY